MITLDSLALEDSAISSENCGLNVATCIIINPHLVQPGAGHVLELRRPDVA
jgi:hypothetical protein